MMDASDEVQWLRRYAAGGDEDAFGRLVARHTGLVYGSAWRQLGDAELAKDAAQAVFIRLARRARSLPANLYLPGWLYRATYFAVSQVRRTERRRQARLASMALMTAESPGQDEPWEAVAPFLDRAMNGLGQLDRQVLLLRYVEGKSLREVGRMVGQSEDTARKRVARALARLRGKLLGQGIDSTESVLAAALASFSGLAVPSGIVVGLSATALAQASNAAGGAWLLWNFMNATKIKMGLAGAAVALSVGTTALLTTRDHRRQAEHQTALRAAEEKQAALRSEIEDWKERALAAEKGLDRIERQQEELARLRGEMVALRQARRDSEGATVPADRLDANSHSAPTEPPPNDPIRHFKVNVNANVPAGEMLIAGGWPTGPGRRGLVLLSPSPLDSGDGGQSVAIESIFINAPEALLAELGWEGVRAEGAETDRGWLLGKEDPALDRLLEDERVEVLGRPKVMTANGVEANVSISKELEIDGQTHSIGPKLTIRPVVDPAVSGVSIDLAADVGVAGPP